ncbi:Aste57867_18613 [Aphanomyces stellatus]|uniref:subtilisin n=1 Tax=Aphanomyces stellatus TaxID=120398 RepID=A0A485LAX2_9STRA|nr:hypothetical protein As57867_018551 [Aphanomyces stellatus]VFT95348.1 Aste57867_18613 [Aphanomyces stellatus]
MVRLALFAALSALATAKVSFQVLRELETADATTVRVTFKSTSRLAQANFETLAKAERAQSVFDLLTAEAAVVTADAVKLAQAAGAKTTTYWIDSSVAIVGANKALIDSIAALPNVAAVNPIGVYTLPVLPDVTPAGNGTAAVEWGVDIIGAPAAWARGNKGKGVIVANIDTGVRGTHEALKTNWRATNGWYEPATSSKLPNDRHGHGSHTMGTIAGGLGIGVAPEATWIACVGCPAGSCPDTDLLACAQWTICPTDTDGKNPDCKLGAHVVSNSWGSTTNGDTWYEASILAWRKAGIIPVFSNGNSGPKCGTVGSPGDSANVIAVGATTSTDGLASFSSKGPSPDNRLKPDVSAPGSQIRSASNAADDKYQLMSGTSMAAPHVAGSVALILAANPGASYDAVYKLISGTVDTAKLTPSKANCGGLDDSKFPNNDYGYGRINVNKASAPSGPTPAPTPTKPAC